MGLFGGNKKHSFLGVDIGASSIKVVELLNEKGRPKLMTYGYSERRPGDVLVSPFDDTRGTADLIMQLCKKAGTTSSAVMAALPSSSIFSTIIAVPRKKDEKEMKPLIDAQVSKLTPLPLSEMITYSTYVDDLKQPKGEKNQDKLKRDYVRVLVTGSAKSLVQKYIEIFKYAKLNLQAIDTEPFALIRALVGKDKSAIMIVDIGFKRTNITVVEKGIPFLTRSINIGGSSVTKRIMEQMGMDEAQAEQFKTDLGMLPPQTPTVAGGLPAILESVMLPIVNEMRYSFELYENMEQSELDKVEKVIVTGGTSHLPHIPEFFAETLNMNVYRGDPWARVVYPEELRPVLEDIGPKMSVPIGLAMREIES